MKFYSTLNYPRWAIVNFIVLSIFGVLLRYMQLYDVSGIDYQFIMHAHSHFAFSGWIFFSIALLIAPLCNGGKLSSSFKVILLLALVSAYGMLVSFSWQGYKLISIGFSTLFVLVTFYFTYLVFKSNLLKDSVNSIAYKFIRGSLILLCLSALGPFALGPLAAAGLQHSPYYHNAIYLYLHFQMNGFMLLAVVGLLASTMSVKLITVNQGRWLNIFIFSTIPLYFIFTLWNKPGNALWILACIGTGLNLVGWLVLCFYYKGNWRYLSFLERAALIALTLKCIFQLLVCIPAIGNWTFLNRNLIIGYIHLLTLGVIMPLLIGQFIRTGLIKCCKLTATANILYIILIVVYLCLLFIQPLLSLFSILIPNYQFLLFLLSISFIPVGILLLFKVQRTF
ncbi:MAG: hypothetical protein EOP47_13715 [Sphingobacteriaceae bacterium]|nr:MAG: hypothetical protein EOP47_13715 [Sphingobacteriaceae bacterium]